MSGSLGTHTARYVAVVYMSFGFHAVQLIEHLLQRRPDHRWSAEQVRDCRYLCGPENGAMLRGQAKRQPWPASETR